MGAVTLNIQTAAARWAVIQRAWARPLAPQRPETSRLQYVLPPTFPHSSSNTLGTVTTRSPASRRSRLSRRLRVGGCSRDGAVVVEPPSTCELWAHRDDQPLRCPENGCAKPKRGRRTSIVSRSLHFPGSRNRGPAAGLATVLMTLSRVPTVHSCLGGGTNELLQSCLFDPKAACSESAGSAGGVKSRFFGRCAARSRLAL